MAHIGIVGAGMAGLACAEALTNRGHEVVLLDKGRGPGGRMSTRRMLTSAGEAQFDHGAQYFTVRDKAFQRRVDGWIANGLVELWPAAGDGAHVGVPGMNAPIRDMADGQKVRWAARVTRVESYGPRWRLSLERGDAIDVDIAIIALPAEQAAALLAPVAADLAAHASAILTQPCWTVMLAFGRPIAVIQNCWRDDPVIEWAACNSSKPGRSGPESWVLQAGPAWSQRHLEADPDWIVSTLKDALANLLRKELPASIAASSHRWRFARSGADGSGAIWDRARGLGVCGDWLIGPRVEAAWLSGSTLAETIGAAG